MELAEFTPAAPGKGEVLVRVRAAAANGLDWKIRNGDLKLMTGRGFPRGLGHDFAGVVEQVGQGVTRFRAGDEVLGTTSMKAAGAFAEVVLATAGQVVKKPDDLSFEQAAAIPIVGVTALQAITTGGKLKPGQSVFINGCLGNVGRIATQLALRRQATVAGSCRAGTWHDAEALGISTVVDFDFDASGLQGRFDLVFDTAGTLSGKTARTLIKPGGRIIDINGTPAKMLRSALPGPYQMQITKASVQDLESITRAVADGQVRIPIARTVPLAEAPQALAELETRNTPRGGKLVITIG